MRNGPLKWVLLTLLTLAILGALGVAAFVYSGIYNVSALGQHTQTMYALIDESLRASIRLRAREIEPPSLADLPWRDQGVALYQTHCRQCHGAPGVAPDPFALGLTPRPAALIEMARSRSERELFWVIKHGIRMTAMPAWEYRLSEQQMWSLVAFILQSRHLTVEDYQHLSTAAPTVAPAPEASANHPGAGATPAERGLVAIQQYGCFTCHAIPEVTGAEAHVGPSLHAMADRAFIAGVLPNTTQNMIRWLIDPQQIDPLTAMPDLGVTERDAADMAAYLNTLKADR